MDDIALSDFSLHTSPPSSTSPRPGDVPNGKDISHQVSDLDQEDIPAWVAAAIEFEPTLPRSSTLHRSPSKPSTPERITTAQARLTDDPMPASSARGSPPVAAEVVSRDPTGLASPGPNAHLSPVAEMFQKPVSPGRTEWTPPPGDDSDDSSSDDGRISRAKGHEHDEISSHSTSPQPKNQGIEDRQEQDTSVTEQSGDDNDAIVNPYVKLARKLEAEHGPLPQVPVKGGKAPRLLANGQVSASAERVFARSAPRQADPVLAKAQYISCSGGPIVRSSVGKKEEGSLAAKTTILPAAADSQSELSDDKGDVPDGDDGSHNSNDKDNIEKDGDFDSDDEYDDHPRAEIEAVEDAIIDYMDDARKKMREVAQKKRARRLSRTSDTRDVKSAERGLLKDNIRDAVVLSASQHAHTRHNSAVDGSTSTPSKTHSASGHANTPSRARVHGTSGKAHGGAGSGIRFERDRLASEVQVLKFANETLLQQMVQIKMGYKTEIKTLRSQAERMRDQHEEEYYTWRQTLDKTVHDVKNQLMRGIQQALHRAKKAEEQAARLTVINQDLVRNATPHASKQHSHHRSHHKHSRHGSRSSALSEVSDAERAARDMAACMQNIPPLHRSHENGLSVEDALAMTAEIDACYSLIREMEVPVRVLREHGVSGNPHGQTRLSTSSATSSTGSDTDVPIYTPLAVEQVGRHTLPPAPTSGQGRRGNSNGTAKNGQGPGTAAEKLSAPRSSGRHRRQASEPRQEQHNGVQQHHTHLKRHMREHRGSPPGHPNGRRGPARSSRT